MKIRREESGGKLQSTLLIMDNPVPHNEIEKQTTEKEIKPILKYQTINLWNIHP